jgi:hypothetical protein
MKSLTQSIKNAFLYVFLPEVYFRNLREAMFEEYLAESLAKIETFRKENKDLLNHEDPTIREAWGYLLALWVESHERIKEIIELARKG